MSRGLAVAALALNLALCWWLALSVAAVLIGGLLSPLTGGVAMALPFFGALFVFPVLAIGLGLLLARRQLAAVGGQGPAALFTVVAEHAVHADLPAEALLRLSEGALQAVLRGALQSHPDGYSATLRRAESAAAGWPALHEHQLSATVHGDATSATLSLRCAPRLEWLYRTLLVDRGRSARHVAAVAQAVQERLRIQLATQQARQQQEARRARQSEAELQALRAQIEPHFLFNTLAHIQACLQSEVAVAERMLGGLIAFLRSNHRAWASATLRLDQELEMVEHYLALIQLRLGTRLRYTLQAPALLGACRVPPAAVLVLVENAVKHGIERRAAGGAIHVECTRAGERLLIACENQGPPFAALGAGRGGLGNLQERLGLMYGSAASIEVENRDAERVCVRLSLPATEQA